jgi:hypothetical protein
MSNIQIKHRYTGAVLFECEAVCHFSVNHHDCFEGRMRELSKPALEEKFQ